MLRCTPDGTRVRCETRCYTGETKKEKKVRVSTLDMKKEQITK